ncbi:MFS transporter [Thalassotalea nanhaiensis]|uniref:MFS transporter n=1 Tax=Thalassotalea nanhaiensis TaxID=3065648 RepID=A0ABY9TJ86_9GAMM|nr:MFS transporter [Colwelliaceae bacterium SQ345]
MIISSYFLRESSNIFDGWRSLSIALFMALVGYSVMVSIPVLSTAWVEMLGFTEEQVGRVAGADLGGFSVGAVLAASFVGRMNRQLLVLIGIIISIASNALCMAYVEYEQVLWLRVAAGFGSGIFTAVAVTSLGGTTKPARAFNLLLFAFAFSQALELYILPKLSMDGIYLFFIGLTVVCLLFIRWVPKRPLNDSELAEQEKHEDSIEDWHVPKILPWFCLAAISFTYINIGGYWTYIELAALSDGIADDWIGKLLVLTSFFSIVGCLVATLLSDRFGLFKPLICSLLAMAIIVGMLSSGITDLNIMISLFSFNLLWIFVDVFQTAMVAHMDRSGSLVALVPGAQGFGQIIGPNVAASVLGAELGYDTMFLVSGSMALIAMLIYIGVYYTRFTSTYRFQSD